MALRVLWVENDTMPAIDTAIREGGYLLDHAYFLSQAEEFLKSNIYDVVIIDILMAIEPEDIEAGYTAVETVRGNEAGLAFYRRHRRNFEKMRAGVLVYSVLGRESNMKDKFVALGLPQQNFFYKVSEANVNYLLEDIAKVLRRMGKKRG